MGIDMNANQVSIELARINWIQTIGIALFSIGFVIIGFIYSVSSNAITEAAVLMNIRNISNSTINTGLKAIGNQAKFTETVLLIAAIIAILAGGSLFKLGSDKLNSLEKKAER